MVSFVMLLFGASDLILVTMLTKGCHMKKILSIILNFILIILKFTLFFVMIRLEDKIQPNI